MKKILSITLFLLGIFAYLLLYGVTVGDELSNGVLRFHILANSDSNADRQIKLAVRDYVSERLAEEDILQGVGEYAKKAEKLANEYLANNAVAYSATATTEKVYIPRKSYKNITMPSGRYDAIRLLLGSGNGENWWCVAYPALCFSESFEGELSPEAKSKLSENMSQESYSVITDKREYRLFIVDLVGRLMEML